MWLDVTFDREAFEKAITNYGKAKTAHLLGILPSALSHRLKRHNWSVDDLCVICNELEIDPTKFFIFASE